MGCSASLPREEVEVDKKIDEELKKASGKQTRKILILGTGGSGKSTLLKQLRPDELNNYRTALRVNVLHAANDFLTCIQNFDPILASKYAYFVNLKLTGERVSPEFVDQVDRLMGIEQIKEFVAERCMSDLWDSSTYILSNFKRLAAPDCTPTTQDILQLRTQTTGIIEQIIEREDICLKFDRLLFRMCDVGGQKSERKKWFRCFQDVNSILYVASLSDYDRSTTENPDLNCLHDSLTLLKTLCSAPDFRSTPIIVFLNKKDLFDQKIRHVPLANYFPDYIGPNVPDEALQFIRKKFIAASSETMKRRTLLQDTHSDSTKRKIYLYETCATDTQSIKFVFDACSHTILSKNISEMGF